MSPSQRAPYEAMAKADKMKGKSGGEKYSSQGVPLSQIEREKREKELAERLMKKEIEDTVKDGFANDSKYSNNGFEIGNEKNCFFFVLCSLGHPKVLFRDGQLLCENHRLRLHPSRNSGGRIFVEIWGQQEVPHFH